MTSRVTCECGMCLVDRTNFGFLKSLDIHKDTEKHKLMLQLKRADPESNALALNPKTEKVHCLCGQMVCRWTMPKHQQTETDLKKSPRKRRLKHQCNVLPMFLLSCSKCLTKFREFSQSR